MMDKPIRVLQINAGSENFGGVSSFVFNVYKNLDHAIVQFDFLSPNKTTYGIVKDQIMDMGGHIYQFDINAHFFKRTYLLYSKLCSFLKKNRYEIVHINSGSIFFNYVTSMAARKANAQNIIVHSHNGADSSNNPLRKMIFDRLKPRIEQNADYLFSCSRLAARFMFTEESLRTGKVTIINNGIDFQRFHPDVKKRQLLRKQNGLMEKFVVGNIGRFVNQKNQLFLIDVFHKLVELNPNSMLLVYGDGQLKDELIKKIHNLGLKDCVMLNDPIKEIENAYGMMDAFVLTSLYEGLPVTGIEAQAMGLFCLFSDSITDEVKINENVRFLSLEDDPLRWARVLNEASMNKGEDNINQQKLQGYDIVSVASDLCRRYCEMVDK